MFNHLEIKIDSRLTIIRVGRSRQKHQTTLTIFITENQGSYSVFLQNVLEKLSLQDQESSISSQVGLTASLHSAMPPQRRKRAEVVEEESKSNSKRQRVNTSSRKNSRGNDITDLSFSSKACSTLFQEYATANDPDVIGPEGMEKFCEDIGVEPENHTSHYGAGALYRYFCVILMLVLAWKMEAKQMGFFTRSEWQKGLTDLQCDSISKIQNKTEYLRNLLIDPTHFKSIYRYAYDFARDKDQRSMDIETAKAMLQLLLGRMWSMYGSFHQFLEQSKYKVINKDQWCNVLEFSRTIKPDLSNYDEDGAWPVLLDEYVEWLKLK